MGESLTSNQGKPSPPVQSQTLDVCVCAGLGVTLKEIEFTEDMMDNFFFICF